ncbi:MAG: AbrB/MazE/SpoVT family DNA-binding domain-containing protein [Candidatus Hydrogenedentes bacterium]|nr:AbrB/MazE/SpoVT family DNA-binding domain-containing protein [Candidatus Hydrogenedentota bacterium]
MELTITKIGDAAGVILPHDILARLNVAEGDTVYVTDVPGGVKITTHNVDFDEAMIHAERVMKEDDAALRRLAE